MSACAVAAAAAVLFAAPSAPEVRPRAAVVVFGDPAEAGKIQAEIEGELDRQGILIIRGVGPKIGPPADPPLPREQTEKGIAEVKAAQTAYDAAEFEPALLKIESARSILYNTQELAATEGKIQLHLWAAAINIAHGKKPQAEIEVKNLLRVDPDPVVDKAIFPSEVVQLVETSRQAISAGVVSVSLSGLPEGAIIVVTPPGGTPRLEKAPAFAAEKGAKIRVRAPHFRPAELVVPSDLPSWGKSLQMAVALRDDGDRAARPILDGTPTKSSSTLAALATQAGADALVLVAVRGSQRRGAVVLARNGETTVSKPGDPASVNKFIVGALRPSGSRTLVTERDEGFFPRGGVVVSTWNRTLGDVYDLPLTGTGPALAVDMRKFGGVIAGAEVAYVTYGLTPIEVSVRQESSGTIGEEKGTGGSALRFALDAGYEISAGPVLLGALVGGRFEQYSMKDLKVEGVTTLTSSTYSGGTARARVILPIGDSIRLNGSAGAILAPSFSEAEEGTSGTDPESATAPFWRLGATWQQGEKLNFSFDYAGERRSTTLTGPPRIFVENGAGDDADIELTEMVNTFSITAAYRF